MRLIHTGDWHLGRTFHQVSLLEDQAQTLTEITGTVAEHAVDALIIAGDIFDRANPRRDAIDLFDRFLARIYGETRAAIVVIAGNHDAPERLAFGGALHDPARVLIRGPLDRDPRPLVLHDADGPVAISALPFAGPFAARAHFEDTAIQTPEHVLARQIEEARAHVPAGARWITVAHAFVHGGRTAESERSLDMIGGVETVSSGLFDGADYVALGHLHRNQTLSGGHIHYPGSILRFGFDEVDGEKAVTLVMLDGNGRPELAPLPLHPPRTLRVIEGRFDEIMGTGPSGNSEDFILVRLLDPGSIHDAQARLSSVYPNIAKIEYGRRLDTTPTSAAFGVKARGVDPRTVTEAFFADVTGAPLDDGERTLMATAIEQARSHLDEEGSA